MNNRPSNNPLAHKPDREIKISELDPPDGDYMKEFERIIGDQFGVKVTNLSGHRIGFSKALPGPWRPVGGFRETMKGRLREYDPETVHAIHLYIGSNEKIYLQQEYDWCLYIDLAETYRDKFNIDEIQGEVTPEENFRDTQWFRLRGTEIPSRLLTYDICVYGPYVIDEGSDDGREIHPIDAIWWRRRPPGDNQVRIILLQDAAKGRFREEGMFIRDPRDDEWKPWIEYPQLEEILIPFVYNPQDKRYSDILVEVNKAMDITTHLQPGLVDSDDGPRHQLLQWRGGKLSSVTQLPILVQVTVRVTEEAGFDNRCLAVQFPLTDLTRDAQGVIRGYVRLVAALGDQLNKHEGVMVLTLTFKQGENTPVLHK